MTSSESPDASTGAKLVQEAVTSRREGDAAASLSLYRRAERAFGEDAPARAHCLRHIGDLARELVQLDDARAALREAEHLYRSEVADRLALANTVRLQALIDADKSKWSEARKLYALAATDTGLDMDAALEECDRHLAAN